MTKAKKGGRRPPVVSEKKPEPWDAPTQDEAPAPAPAPEPATGTPITEILGPTSGDGSGETAAALAALEAAGASSGESPAGDFQPIGETRDTRPTDAPEPVRRGRGRPPGSRTRPGTEQRPGATDRRSKAELAARVDQLEKENQALRPGDDEQVESVKPALLATFRVVGFMLSQWRGQHWQFSQDECKALAEAWAVPLAPYLVHSGEALKWATAAGVTWTVLAPRLAKDREKQPIEISPGVEVGNRGEAP